MNDEEEEVVTIVVPKQLLDAEEYRRARLLPLHHEEGSHPCPVGGCNITAEEHHRISFGYMLELQTLRRRLAALEN